MSHKDDYPRSWQPRNQKNQKIKTTAKLSVF